MLRLPCILLAAAGLAGCADLATRQGRSRIRVTTNEQGRVIRAEMLDPVDPKLDEAARQYALREWKGPPNQTKIVPIRWELSGRPSPRTDVEKPHPVRAGSSTSS